MPYIHLVVTDEPDLPVESYGVVCDIKDADFRIPVADFVERIIKPMSYRLHDLHEEREARYASRQ